MRQKQRIGERQPPVLRRTLRRLVVCVAGSALAVGIAIAVGWAFPVESAQFAHFVRGRFHSFVYAQRVELEGVEILHRADVETLLPREKSTFWWLTHQSEVAVTLCGHPFIRRAIVRPCSRWLVDDWGCFRITLDEREPRYLVPSGGGVWFAAADGTFLAPGRKENLPQAIQRFARRGVQPIVLLGVFDEAHDPGVIAGRFHFVETALQVIERETSFGIREVELLDDTEMTIRFQELAPLVRIDPRGGREEIALQMERMRLALADLRHRGEMAEKVDLAVPGLVVVSLSAPPIREAPPSSRTGHDTVRARPRDLP